MKNDNKLVLELPQEMAGRRLDQALAELVPQFSRSRLQQWIRSGNVLVNGEVLKPREKIQGGEQVEVDVVIEQEVMAKPEIIDLNIVYEDDTLVVINKPIGFVMHPATGNPNGTMLNALLHYFPKINQVPRAGIVHRLDKDTSGLLVVAKTLEAQNSLVKQLQKHDVEREYDAIVTGAMISGGTVDAPVGRHPVDRKKMAININKGKEAVTHYRVAERFRHHTHVKLNLETGRTHQIRVHMKHIRHPIAGDQTYGNRLQLPPKSTPALIEELRRFKRQALHASRLKLTHPATGEEIEWAVPLPDDIKSLLLVLRQDSLEADKR